MRCFAAVLFAVTLSAVLYAGGSAQAAYTWDTGIGDGATITDGTGDWQSNGVAPNTWNSGAANTAWGDWQNATIGGGTLGSAGTITLKSTAAYGIATSVVTFNTPYGGGSYTINSNGGANDWLWIDRYLTANTNATINANIKLGSNANDATWTVASGKTLTVGGNIDTIGDWMRFGGDGKYVMTGNYLNTGNLQFINNSTTEYSGSGSNLGWLVVGRYGNSSQTATLKITGGTMTASASFYVGNLLNQGGNGGIVEVQNGTLTSTPTAYLGDYGTGTLTVSGGSFVGNGGVQLGYHTGGVGTVNLNSGSLITTSVTKGAGTATFNFNGGTLQANTFNIGATLANSGTGTLTPGGAVVGSTAITGAYTQGSTAALAIDIASLASFDTLTATASSSLSGLVNVKLLGGYTPAPYSFFDVFTVSGGGTLTASGLTLGGPDGSRFAESIVGGNTLRLTVVPEPTTLILLATGLLGLLAYAWRKRK